MTATKIFFLITVALVLMVFIAPVYASTTDRGIESAARDSYTFKTYLRDDDVRVQAGNGVVTLTGTVADESRKALAGDTVANLPGVKEVENNLEFQVESSPDLWLKTKVKTTLLFHRNVSSSTDVDVNDGVVTLRGEADNQVQKDLTAEYTQDIVGVKSINNEMVVKTTTEEPQQPENKATGYRLVGETTSDRALDDTDMDERTVVDNIDDASITAQVRMTLLSNRSTSGLQTQIETRDGVVSLNGKAGNDAEKALVTKLANDVKGVKSVDNNMTVDSKMTTN